MIGSFLSLVYSAIGIDMSSTVIGYFKSRTRTMMSSGFCNSSSTYCFSFYLNFLYWSFSFLCSSVAPKTAPKSSTSPLKLQIDDVYSVQLKLPHCVPRHWKPPLPTQLPWPHSWPPLLELDSLVVLRPQVVFASLSL